MSDAFSQDHPDAEGPDARGMAQSGGAQSGASIAATPFTTETMPDPFAGGDATMSVLVFPADQTALAIKIEGADFPWLLIPSSGGEGLYFGDGSYDPFDAGPAFWANADGTMVLYSPAAINARADIMFQSATKGVVLAAPDTSLHRLKVGNDGTVTSEPVV